MNISLKEFPIHEHESDEEEEVAATAGLSEALGTIIEAVEQFQHYNVPSDPVYWQNATLAPLPTHGRGTQSVLEIMRKEIIPNGLPIGAPGFSGYVTTAPTTIPIAMQLAATVAGAQREWLHAFNHLEAQALAWIAEILGFSPEIYTGIFTSGGAISTLVCLAAARQHVSEQLGIDAAQVGIAGIPKPRFYGTKEVHGVIHRATSILGFGRDAIVAVPTTASFQLDVAALKGFLQADRDAGCTPIAVIATAGTAGTGAVDPFDQIAALCEEMNLWLHVDGAYGLPGILDPRVEGLFEGVHKADSWIVDPHKWFATPVGCGAAFVRDGAMVLKRTFALGPCPVLEHPVDNAPITSQFDSWGNEFGTLGLESSSPSRGAIIWALIQEIGLEGIRQRVRRHIAYARLLAQMVACTDCLEPVALGLSICCFRYVPSELQELSDGREKQAILNHLNALVLKRIRARGRCFPSSSTIEGKFVLRACYINPRTSRVDVVALIEEVIACGHKAWVEIHRPSI